MFQADDAERFFGRDRLVTELADRVDRQRLVVVVGPSGSGKSSLLRAGLVNHARTNGVRGIPGPVTVLTPGPHPLEECAAHLAAFSGGEISSLHTALHTDPRSLHQTVLHALVNAPADGLVYAERAEVLVVVDQFEEVFTLCRDAGEQAQFLAVLRTAARVSNSRTRIVLGLRADFYAHCTQHPELVEALRDAQVVVGPMTTEELQTVITQPALDAGCRVETALVSRIVAEATGQPGVLPLVSHALLETWRRRRGTTLTLAGYQAAGGITQSIAHTAEVVYAGLSEEQQQWARQLFLRLVALGEGTEDTKRRVAHTELQPTGQEHTEVLERLASARLVTLDRDGVEITHEALVRCWPRLHGWLTDNRESLQVHRRLTEATSAWEAVERDPGALYRGIRLAQAEQWAATGDTDVLSLRERDFLQASLSAETRTRLVARRRTRRLRQLLVLLTALLMVTTGATVYAQRAQDIANDQRNAAIAQKAISQAAALRATDPALSLQLGLAAYRLDAGPEAHSALLNSFATPYAARLTDHTGGVTSIAFSSDSRTMVTTGQDGVTRIWDVTAPHHPRELARRTARVEVRHAAFSPDRRTLAVVRFDATTELWDITDPGRPRTVAELAHSGLEAAFSPDNRTLAVVGRTGDRQGGIKLWDVSEPANPREQATLTGQFGPVFRVTFLPHSPALATVNLTAPDPTSDSELRLWDVTDPSQPRETATVTGLGRFAIVAFSPDGRTVAATPRIGDSVTMWDVTDMRRPRTLGPLTGLTGGLTALAFSPDNKTLAAAYPERTIKLWDVGAGHRAQTLTTITGPTATTVVMAFSPDGRTLATMAVDNTIRLDDVSQYTGAGRAHGYVRSVSFHPDGRTLAAAHNDGTIGLWDTADPYRPQERMSLAAIGENVPVIWLAFSPDGRSIAGAGADGTLALWHPGDARQPPAPVVVDGPDPEVLAASVAFSPDGRMLAVGHSNGTVEVWDVDQPQATRLSTVGNAAEPVSVAFHPNSRLLAATSATNFALWDLTDPRNPHNDATTKAPAGVSVAFSPDGHTMATGHISHSIRLWDVRDPRTPEAMSALDLTSTASVLAFSPDGRFMAAGTGNGTTELWNVADPLHPRDLASLVGPVNGGYSIGSASFSSNNNVLATAGAYMAVPDRTWYVWDIDTERIAAHICELAWPRITEPQWRQYFPDLAYQPPCS